MSGSQRSPQPVITTYKGVLIEIERVRDGGWHWRLDKGQWSYDSSFMQPDALKTAVDAKDKP